MLWAIEKEKIMEAATVGDPMAGLLGFNVLQVPLLLIGCEKVEHIFGTLFAISLKKKKLVSPTCMPCFYLTCYLCLQPYQLKFQPPLVGKALCQIKVEFYEYETISADNNIFRQYR